MEKQGAGFTLKCNYCGTTIIIEDEQKLEKIHIGSSIDFKTKANITCQRCGNYVWVK